MLYFIIITATMAITTLSSVLVSLSQEAVPLWYALLAPMTVNAYVLILLGVLCLFMRLIIPKKFWSKPRKFFNVKRWEIPLYKKLHIQQWKDKVPEMGRAGGFPKDHIRSTQPAYLEKFISETCFAEWMHFVVGAAGFTALIFYPSSHLFFVLPILIVNFILHLLLCLIQRYNRYRLTIVYSRLESRGSCEEAEIKFTAEQIATGKEAENYERQECYERT